MTGPLRNASICLAKIYRKTGVIAMDFVNNFLFRHPLGLRPFFGVENHSYLIWNIRRDFSINLKHFSTKITYNGTMKKTYRAPRSWLTIGLLALLPVFSSCGASLEPVIIEASLTPVAAATDLANFDQFTDLVADSGSFVLTITNPTCTCTTEFLPHFDRYLSENDIPGYTLRYSLVLYETEKHGLPVVDSNSPILVIYADGSLRYAYSHETGNSKHNRVFTVYDDLLAYLSARIQIAIP